MGASLLLALVFGSLRVFLHGDELGEFVATMLNRKMRGRIEIGAIDWPVSAIPTAITGGWVPITVRNVRVWDDCMQSAEGRRRSSSGDQVVLDLPCAPDERRSEQGAPRKLLLQTDKITAEIDIHALFFGYHDLVFRNIRVSGGDVLIEQATEPYPLHDYDKTTISLVSAFQPRMKAGFRAGIFADKAPPVFDLRDVHLEHIGVTYHQRPEFRGDRARYPVTLRVEDASVDSGPEPNNQAFLYADASDPLVGKLYLSVPIHAGPGTLRIDDEGPAEDFGIGPLSADQQRRRKARYQIELTSVDVSRLAQLPRRWLDGDPIARTLELRLTAQTAQGGRLSVSGELKDYWDRPFAGTWALDVVGEDLGPTLTAAIDPALSGDHLSARLRLRGPFIANPRIEYQASGLEYETLRPKTPADPPALRLALAQLNGELDLVNDQGHLDETIAQVLGDDGQPSRGKIQLDATFGLKPYQVNNADLHILEAIDLGRFLPESVRRHLGRYVRGDVSGNGDTTTGFALRKIDLVIGHRPSDVSARLWGGRIFTTDNFSTLEVAREQPLHARLAETSTTISGSVLARARWLKLKLSDVESPDLGRWLARLNISPLASSASDGSVEIAGPMTSPAVTASATLAGVPVIGQVSVATRLENQVLDITDLQSTALGGAVTGTGRVRLGGAPFVEKLTVSGAKLSAERLASAAGAPGRASGTIDELELSVRGSLGRKAHPLDWLDLVDAHVQADRLTIAGDAYDDLGLCVSHGAATRPICRRRDASLADADEARCAAARRKGGTCVVAHASRSTGGDLDLLLAKTPGEARSRGRRGPAELSGSIDVSALPLALLDRFAGRGSFGGSFGALLTLGGTTAAPTASGTIEILRGWAKGSFYGDSRLRVTPVDDPQTGRALRLDGTALGGRLSLSATIGTSAPFPVELRVSGRRIELDPLFGDALAKLPFPLRAWASGEVRVRAELAPSGPSAPPPEAWIELSEFEAIVDYRSGDQLAPLRFSALPTTQRRSALSIRLTPTSLEFACPTPASDGSARGGYEPCISSVATPAGVLRLSGAANERALNLLAEGRLELALLGPLLAQQFDELSGSISVRALLGGSAAAPNPQIEVRLANVRARPTGLETVVQVPTGLVRLANSSVGFTGVRVLVEDTHLREGGELTVGGSVALEDWLPARWAVIITGKIAGKMLLALAPQAISQASGLATIDQSAALIGRGLLPSISATLLFDAAEPLTIIPRGVRREFAFRTGSLSVETGATVAGKPTYEVALSDVTASIDNEGTLRRLRGELALRNGEVVSADVRLDVDAIPFRSPNTLDLLLSGGDVRLRLTDPRHPWQVGGAIEIVNGKFSRNFAPEEFLRPTTPPPGRNRPFWEEWPQLGNAQLRLKVAVRQMAVANNIADIDMLGELTVGGTPRDPRIAGAISVQRGTFRIQGSRAKFTRTKGNVDFNQARRFPDQTPILAIESEADYRDPTGRDHLITLTVGGTIFQPEWDLRTNTGYNKSQTLALIFFGRTPEQVRQSIGDGALGTDPTRIDPTTNPSAGAADQLIKDFAGNWVSLLLGNSLEKITHLDLLQFQVAFGSIGLRGEKKLTKNWRAGFEVEKTVRGRTYNVHTDLRTPFRITLQGAYLNKDFDSEAEQDIEELQGKMVFRLFIP
ncbi:MAG: translocation/assembly module TamB domain-containing protein [Kofleriaceae bacterium]